MFAQQVLQPKLSLRRYAEVW